MQSKTLEKIGLNSSEAEIYLALLKVGSCKAGRLAKETGFHRTTVYKALESLIRRGLISSSIKENRSYFEPADPSNIIKELDRQEKEIEERKQEIGAILPDLKSLFEQNKEPLEATIYRGVKGLKTVFNEIQNVVTKKGDFFIFGVPQEAEQIWGYFEEFNNNLHKKGVHYKIIFDERAKENILSCKKYHHVVKTLPKEYMSPTEVNIYGDNIAIVLWDKNPLAIVIRGKKIAEGFKQYFKLLWKIAK